MDIQKVSLAASEKITGCLKGRPGLVPYRGHPGPYLGFLGPFIGSSGARALWKVLLVSSYWCAGLIECIKSLLEAVLGSLEDLLGHLEAVMDPLGTALGPIEAVLGTLEAVPGSLGLSWTL